MHLGSNAFAASYHLSPVGCDCSALLQGDWGTQFGMLIQFLAEARPQGLADPTIADLALPELQVCLDGPDLASCALGHILVLLHVVAVPYCFLRLHIL